MEKYLIREQANVLPCVLGLVYVCHGLFLRCAGQCSVSGCRYNFSKYILTGL